MHEFACNFQKLFLQIFSRRTKLIQISTKTKFQIKFFHNSTQKSLLYILHRAREGTEKIKNNIQK